MIPVTRFLLGRPGGGDGLRFSRPGAPVVVWHLTPRCDLRCRHCYAATEDRGELTPQEERRLLDELAALGVPVLLLSGGEPLLHPRFWTILDEARRRGLRVALSTNGVHIDGETARRLGDAGIVYAGVSIDGDERTSDAFRGVRGAFRRAERGIVALTEAGVRTGLRFTLARSTAGALEAVFSLAGQWNAARLCVYHFVPAGRGAADRAEMLSRSETRAALTRLAALAEGASDLEVLTVDNAADGIFFALSLLRRGEKERAGAVLELLRRSGGNRSGEHIVSLRWDGFLFPDQFSWGHPLGRFPEQSLEDALRRSAFPLAIMLRDRKSFVKGRCRECRWFDCCNGNLRARAEALTGDFWGEDGGCPLEDGEIRSA